MLGGAAGLAHLPRDQLSERLGDDSHRVGTQPRHQPRRRREQVVAGQDRDVVAPPGVGAGRAATHLRLVHHVVVVQRRQVHQLDDGTADGDLPGVGIGAELGGQHREQRAEAFATGLEQMLHRLGHQLVGLAQLGGHQVLDARHAVADVGGEGGVAEVHPRHHGRRCPHWSNILGSVDTRRVERSDSGIEPVRTWSSSAPDRPVPRRPPGPPAAAATCW